MPTSATHTYTPNRLDPALFPESAVEYNAKFAATQTIAKGTVLGRVTASGELKAYASGNSDGSQNPTCIAAYSITVDASNNITLEGELGVTRKVAPVYLGGYFNTADLTGLDANAVTKLGACVVVGDLTTGIVRI